MFHEKYMHRCLQLAKNGLGRTAPNPMVGAVLVHEDRIIGEGFHTGFGEPHAEVMAIRGCKQQELLPYSTLYINLEPCSHHGKTPPCTDLILEKKIPRVVISNTDPNPLVAGKGIEKLKQAGTEIISGICEEEGEALNRRFFTFHRKKRPYLILKWAQTADGFLDGTGAAPLKISSPATDQLVHFWRTQEQGIWVGYRTALKDNPRLTARLFPGKNPLRIVTDPENALPARLHLFSDGNPTVVFNAKQSGKEKSREYIQAASLPDMLRVLFEKQVQSVLVEGGAATLAQFIQAGLWDEARVIVGSISAGEGLRAPELTHAELYKKEDSAEDRIYYYKPKRNGQI
jgi:diaminohydroxyphosphoribosylaminopyrimidine deaminase/5-amino-6-(5-phosphoribosylamino)uracil reductase